jgi:O-antigen ligase
MTLKHKSRWLLYLWIIVVTVLFVPTTDGDFVWPKWWIFYGGTIGFGALTFKNRNEALSSMPLFILVVSLYSISSVLLFGVSAYEYLLTIFSFLLACLVLSNFFRQGILLFEHWLGAVALAAVISSIIGIIEIWWTGSPVSSFYATGRSVMGHRNLSAQICGLGFVAILGMIRLKRRIGFWFWAQMAGLALVSLFAVLSACRSAAIGLVAATLFIIYSSRDTSQKTNRRQLGIAVMAILIGLLISIFQSDIASVKFGNAVYRVRLWVATLDLIKHHPMGVGPGNFPFAIQPYKLRNLININETSLDLTAHNELLSATAELGLVNVILLLGFIAVLLRRLFRESSANDSEKSVVIGFLIFLFFEAAFQFPSRVAPTVLVFASIIGFIYSKLQPRANEASFARVLVPVVTILFILWTCTIAIKREDAPKYSRLEFICNATGDWEACIMKANLESLFGQNEMSIKTISDLLYRSPCNHLALKALAEQYRVSGEIKLSCGVLHLYDRLFALQSTIHQRYLQQCSTENETLPAFVSQCSDAVALFERNY